MDNKEAISILLVDDEDIIIKSLTRLLEKQYKVLSALNGQKALEILNTKGVEIGVIITDQRMPEMTGVDFLKESLSITPNAIRIILTGYTDLNDIVKAINDARIYKFLLKPIDPSQFLLEIKRAVELYEKESQNRRAISSLTIKNESLEIKIKDLNKSGQDNFLTYEEMRKSLVETPLHYFDAISENLSNIKDTDEFIRRKTKILRLAKDGKNFINFSKDLSLSEKLTIDFWKLEEIISEVFSILVEWKNKKYLKLISNIDPSLKIFVNKTLLRDMIFVHAIIHFAENIITGDTIYINAESFDEDFCTVIITSSKIVDKLKVEEMFLDIEGSTASIYKIPELYFIHKLLQPMKAEIFFSKTNSPKASFIAINLKSRK